MPILNLSFGRIENLKLLSAAVSLAAAVSCLPLNAQTPAPAAGNLLSNGDFSAATTDPTWPDDWGKKAAGMTLETENGKHFLRLVAQEPNKMLTAYREVVIPVGVTNVTITFHYRTSNITVGTANYMDARAIFHWMDDNRKPVKPDPHLVDFSKDAGTWTEATETVPVPPGATRLVLMPSLYLVTSGTLDLADVSVTPAP